MGIILFEMTYPFATGMERVEVMKRQAVLFIYEYYLQTGPHCTPKLKRIPERLRSKVPNGSRTHTVASARRSQRTPYYYGATEK